MRRSLVAGNWKMHGNQASIGELLKGLVAELAAGINGVDIAVCPPFPYLLEVSRAVRGCEIVLGAQNSWCEPDGAFTGEVAPGMLADCQVRYVIVGHSERRQLLAETSELVARKFVMIQQAGLIPILCLGETLAQRSSGVAEATVAAQLDAVLDLVDINVFERAVIAYEPVWAIGTGVSATAEQAQAMHAFVRRRLAARDADVAEAVQILYGGSVSPDNAVELFAQSDIDGGLVGGASLNAQAFIQICKSVS
jgi:triosephosphate isomerase (TIM)